VPRPAIATASSARSKPGSGIAPFWTSTHRFFGFPLQLGPLFYLLLLSACSLLSLVLMMFLPFWAAILVTELGIALATVRYGFRIIHQTSRGLLHSSDFRPNWQQGPAASLPWKLLGILIAWGFLAGWVGKSHPTLGLVINLGVSLAFPAIVVTLVQDESFSHSLNPLAWLRVMRAFGWSYLVLILFTLLLSQGGESAMGWLVPRVSRMLLLPTAHAVSIYFFFVTCSLLGYVMYQHHEALDIDLQRPMGGGGRAEAEDDSASRSREVDRHVSELIAAGEMAHALDVAYEAQRHQPDDLKAQARYHQMLTLAGKPDRLGHHAARTYVPLLLKKDMASRALEVFKACRDAGVAVDFDSPAPLLALARHQYKLGDAQAALDMVQDAETRHPGHDLLPSVLEFQVRVLLQGLHDKPRAVALAQRMQARYPASRNTEEALWLTR
jgi:hypothetical protein